MSLGKQVCEEHCHQCAGSSPEFCFCTYAGPPSPGQLSPAEGFLGRVFVHGALKTAHISCSLTQPCLGSCLCTAALSDRQASKAPSSEQTPGGTVLCLPKLICKSKQHESATGHCSSPVSLLLFPAAWILCLEHCSFSIP